MMHYWDELGYQEQRLVTILFIIIVAFVFTKLFHWLINKLFESDTNRLKLDPTMFKFLKNAFSALIWIVAFGTIVYTVPRLRAIAITLFAGAGIFVAILGLAAQQAFSNIISGIFIVMFKPFRVGDMIKVGGFSYGIVEDITLRHTIINNFENKRIVIPNSVISAETVINDSIQESKICRFVEVGISYDSDIDLAIKIIQEEATNHPKNIDNRSRSDKSKGIPRVIVRHVGFGDFSINLRAYVWTNDPVYAIAMHSEINIAIKKRFDKEGIEIPFPYRTIVYKKDIVHEQKSVEGEK